MGTMKMYIHTKENRHNWMENYANSYFLTFN